MSVNGKSEIRSITREEYCSRFTEVYDVGSGSFGKVIKALDNKMKKLVAIKVIVSKDSFEETYKKVQNEVSMMIQFDSKQICKYYDSFYVKNEFYIVMEYCNMGNISQYKMKMNSNIIFCILCDVCKGLENFHKNCYVHYDIKPQNILLTSSGDFKICDFGIMGCAMENQQLITKSISSLKKGTEMYMAPEIKNENKLSAAADIYSLGMTIFEMIAGVPLCLTKCDDVKTWFEQNGHKFSNGKPINSLIENIVLAALTENPTQRITATEILKKIPSLPQNFIILKDIISISNDFAFN